MTKPLIYLAGSLRNPAIVSLHKNLEASLPSFEVFSDWKAAHEAGDDAWKEYEQARGRSYKEALSAPAARNIYEFDKAWIDKATIMVLALPAGRSGHLELGYAIGKGKLGYILLEPDADPRWDVMYQFATAVCETVEELVAHIGGDARRHHPSLLEIIRSGRDQRPELDPRPCVHAAYTMESEWKVRCTHCKAVGRAERGTIRWGAQQGT